MERGELLWAIALTAVAACSDPATEAADAVPAVDAGPADAAPAVCGDGVVSGDEACDGADAACSDLAGSFGAGLAACRADCSGWDVRTCTVTTGRRFETVAPGQRDPRWADARCNDGTAFAAYVRLNPTSSTWVIDLQGGTFCDDQAIDCAQRAVDDPDLVTTIPHADRSVGAGPDRGVLSRDQTLNPDFAGVNHVLAHYCSSDFWAGATTARRPTGADPAGWYFSGRANVAALFGVLAQRYGLDDSRPGLHVLLMGTSAGAHGAHFNLRSVEDWLPTTMAAGRLKVFADAGWMFDWDEPLYRIINTTTSDREVWRAAVGFWGAHLDPVCEAAAADPMDCWFGVGWYPYATALAPIMVQQSRRDGSFGGFLHGPNLDYDLWQAAAETSLSGVTRLWSGSTVYHTLSGSDDGWNTGTSPNTLREAVARFFFTNGPPERILF